MDPKVAIICLTRGYEDVRDYNMLIQRNIAIYNHINIGRGWWPWPLLIFHEGNIELAHQEYIRARSGAQPLFFIDVASEFTKPAGFDEEKELDKRWPWGYKCMCRFFAGSFRHYVRDFDYTIRIDEDCILSRWPSAAALGRPGALLQYPYLSDETHDFTNELLPKITQSYLKAASETDLAQSPHQRLHCGACDAQSCEAQSCEAHCSRQLTCRGLTERHFYNHQFPYTNVWIMSARLFDKPHVTDFLDYLDAFHFSLYYRIGDLPILGVVMNQFLEEGEHCLLEGCEYYHASHDQVIGASTTSYIT